MIRNFSGTESSMQFECIAQWEINFSILFGKPKIFGSWSFIYTPPFVYILSHRSFVRNAFRQFKHPITPLRSITSLQYHKQLVLVDVETFLYSFSKCWIIKVIKTILRVFFFWTKKVLIQSSLDSWLKMWALFVTTQKIPNQPNLCDFFYGFSHCCYYGEVKWKVGFSFELKVPSFSFLLFTSTFSTGISFTFVRMIYPIHVSVAWVNHSLSNRSMLLVIDSSKYMYIFICLLSKMLSLSLNEITKIQ